MSDYIWAIPLPVPIFLFITITEYYRLQKGFKKPDYCVWYRIKNVQSAVLSPVKTSIVLELSQLYSHYLFRSFSLPFSRTKAKNLYWEQYVTNLKKDIVIFLEKFKQRIKYYKGNFEI